MSLPFKRLKQVLKYGWFHSGVIQTESNRGVFFRTKVFIDILYCFNIYKMWSNQYLKEKFYFLSKSERKLIGEHYIPKGVLRDEWQKDFESTKTLLAKYSTRKYDLPTLISKRIEAYKKHYNMGDNCVIEHDVELSRQHYLEGTIKIGNNVLLAKNVFIDYSGHVEIDDNVKLANGVIIESHYRDLEAYEQGKDVNVQTNIHICEGAYIGSRAIILSSCHYIGKHARIGAGAVVTKDVPDYALVAGVPAKIIKMLNEDKK